MDNVLKLLRPSKNEGYKREAIDSGTSSGSDLPSRPTSLTTISTDSSVDLSLVSTCYTDSQADASVQKIVPESASPPSTGMSISSDHASEVASGNQTSTSGSMETTPTSSGSYPKMTPKKKGHLRNKSEILALGKDGLSSVSQISIACAQDLDPNVTISCGPHVTMSEESKIDHADDITFAIRVTEEFRQDAACHEHITAEDLEVQKYFKDMEEKSSGDRSSRYSLIGQYGSAVAINYENQNAIKKPNRFSNLERSVSDYINYKIQDAIPKTRHIEKSKRLDSESIDYGSQCAISEYLPNTERSVSESTNNENKSYNAEAGNFQKPESNYGKRDVVVDVPESQRTDFDEADGLELHTSGRNMSPEKSPKPTPTWKRPKNVRTLISIIQMMEQTCSFIYSNGSSAEKIHNYVTVFYPGMFSSDDNLKLLFYEFLNSAQYLRGVLIELTYEIKDGVLWKAEEMIDTTHKQIDELSTRYVTLVQSWKDLQVILKNGCTHAAETDSKLRSYLSELDEIMNKFETQREEVERQYQNFTEASNKYLFKQKKKKSPGADETTLTSLQRALSQIRKQISSAKKLFK